MALTGIWGSLISAGANVGLGLYNNHFNAKQARASDERSYRYAKKLYTMQQLYGPSLYRKGLEKAGYNPMLALGGLSPASASMASTHSSQSNLGLDSESAIRAGKALEELTIDTAEAQKENIEADTKLKEGQLGVFDVQKAKAEAEMAMLYSQTERADLAYWRDIADTVTSIAGAGATAYSVKSMADVARANAEVHARNAAVNERNQSLKEAGSERSRTVQRYDKNGKLISTDEISESANPMKRKGVSDVNSSANPTVKPNPSVKPNLRSKLGGKFGHSARAAGGAAGAGLLIAPYIDRALNWFIHSDDMKKARKRTKKDIEKNNYTPIRGWH